MQRTWEPDLHKYLTPDEAWAELMGHIGKYYRKYAAPYGGDRKELNVTAERGAYWKRSGKCKVHVPIAADIAATSADLLFSEEPRFTCFHDKTEDNESDQQLRLDELISLNNIHGKLNEAAESCAALGDVFLKLNWMQDELDHPIVTVTQADAAWPEYVMGILKCIHFFSVYRFDEKTMQYWRIYERYEPGKITMALFLGNAKSLGTLQDEAALNELGYAGEITPPIPDMLAVHIPNIKPNRQDRSGFHGRSDFDGLRGLMDALDETYSSWMRDIRLAKARLIVPAEFLRRKPSDLFEEGRYTYEFDEDVETLVALDINPELAGATSITNSQFAIRAQEHAETCMDIIRNIVSIAGYAPQSFGIHIEGMAQSGTALHIREKKSFNTKGKKQTYWKTPLERIMSAMIHLDAAIYPDKGSHGEDNVKVYFADGVANDITTTASAIEMLHRAAAVSTELKVQMQHPDWTKKQIDEEVVRVKEEFGMAMNDPMLMRGDFEPPDDGDDEDDDDDAQEIGN